jgi:hypothetical protein
MIETAAAILTKTYGGAGHERIGAGPVLLLDVIRDLAISAAVSIQNAYFNDVSCMISMVRLSNTLSLKSAGSESHE